MAAEHSVLTGSLENRLFQAVYLLMTAAGLFFLFYRGCRLLLLYLENRSTRISASRITPDSPAPVLSVQTRLFLFLLLLACWLPWFLYHFPGVMTPDSLSQYSQAMGMTGYSNHHPFVHTLLIRLFTSLGNALFHNVYAGIACYTVFQMTAMALIIVTCIRVLIRCRAGKTLCFVFLLFYALVPYNGIFAVTMWKDILFSGILLLFVLCIYQFLPLYREGKPLYTKPLLFLSFLLWGILVCLMRSNGLYVTAAAAPFLLAAFRKQWKLLLPSLLLILGSAMLIKGPVMDSLGVENRLFQNPCPSPPSRSPVWLRKGVSLRRNRLPS